MNGKQEIPPIVKAVPVLLAGCVIFLMLKELFSAHDTVTEPETAPADTGTEKQDNSTVASVVHGSILPLSVPLAPEISAPAIVPAIAQFTKTVIPTTTPLPKRKRRQIKPEDLATAFKRGALTRTDAVAELQKLDFGHTAAYDALLPDGRFSAWLHFAPDGTIKWKS